MPRVSRKQADQHRQKVVDAASRLFREAGFDGVSVPRLMAAAGLTHGAFYGQFSSKSELAKEACERSFERIQERYEDILDRNAGDPEAARLEYIKRYTAKSHRDAPGLGCPAAALSADVAREARHEPVRAAFAAGFNAMIERMPALLAGRRRKPDRQQTLAAAAMLVGGLMLSRATKGYPVSEEVLEAVRHALLDA